MSKEIIKIKKEIDNISFYIWLFSRYEGKTAKEIVGVYLERKKILIERYIELLKKCDGVDKSEDF